MPITLVMMEFRRNEIHENVENFQLRAVLEHGVFLLVRLQSIVKWSIILEASF